MMDAKVRDGDDPTICALLPYADTIPRIRALLVQGAQLHIAELLRGQQSDLGQCMSKRKRKFLRQWELGRCAVQRERRAAEEALRPYLPTDLVILVGSYIHCSPFV